MGTVSDLARYTDSAAAAGIETVRVAAADATDAIADACRGETVASARPFDVELPSKVVVDPTVSELEAAETGVTPGEFAVADYGTVAITPTPSKEGTVSLFPPRHVAVVRAEDVVPDMAAGFDRIADAFAAGTQDVVLVTGPSTTADMGALVRGVHGPAEMHVVIVES